MRYITIKIIILFTFCCFTGYSQSPSFVNNLNFATSFVCYDGQMTITANVANADAYRFQIRNETTNLWENISGASGSISTSPAVISHTFFGVRENVTTRVIVLKNVSELISNDLTISPQRPTFNFQPLDITQCSGLNAIFRVSSSGIGSLTYQWQINTGGVFQNITNGSEYSGTTGNSMNVLNLANNENGKNFRCLVKDVNNCENYSNSAQLFVNQLSTVVSPTTSTAFCEGQNVQFSVVLNVGTVTNYDWQLRQTSEPGYTSIQKSLRFENSNTDVLKVNGILPNENSYKLNVSYINLTQNSDGTRSSGTCIKSAERTNYTIRPRPARPVQINDAFSCGTGKITSSVVSSNKIFWYADSTTNPIISDNLNFTSPTLSTTTKFFYSLKDAHGCESYKRTFQAVIRPLPLQDFEKNLSICPKEAKFTLNFQNINNAPLDVYVLKHTPSIPNFTDVLSATFTDNFDVNLPNDLSSGDYTFKVFTKNQHCFSETSVVNLHIKTATKILHAPLATSLCEATDQTFQVQYNAENPASFKWYKNDLLLPTETSDSIILENINTTDQANYKVEVTGVCGSEISENAFLQVLPKIQITKQPVQTIVCQNGSTKLQVEATGTGTLNYEWSRNGAITGTNSPELILENVPIAFDNSLIKCKISSDCEPVTFTNEVLLSVDALPVTPSVAANQGFCKSIVPSSLVATPLSNHSLHWFDDKQTELTSNEIDISSIFTKTFYVSQKNSNLCESPKSTTQVSTTEPFVINILTDKTEVCSSGLFNRTGFINTTVSPSVTSGISFELFKNTAKVDANLTGIFEFNGGGIYKITATKGYCSAISEVSITSLHPELANSPTLQVQNEICKNTNINLEASGSFNGGNYAWYNSENGPFISSLGARYTINNVSSEQTWFVAYGITTNNTYCETPRIASQITIKPDLEISAQITNTSCAGLQDGQLIYSVTNGVPPYLFSQNGVSNTSGNFSNLAVGSYVLQVSDAEGCVGEKTSLVGQIPGVIITQQPSNISRCRTNIANFTLAAANYDQIVWEKKLPNSTVFETIAGENLPNLRIENIGNAANPHRTIYRAKLSKGNCAIYTQEATLFVNSITGSGSSKTVCENSSVFFNLNEFIIVGSNKTYQWQYRVGTSGSFTDVLNENTESLNLSNVLAARAGYYRCRITFDNGGGNTCIINTSTSGSQLTIETPEVPTLSGNATICKGQKTTLQAVNCSGILNWSDGKTGLQVDVNPLITSIYTANCGKGTCSTISSNSVTITVNENPINPPVLTTSKTKFCNAETISISATNCSGNVIWSNGLAGANIQITATNSFSISAHCIFQNCQSPQSQTINITVYPVLTPGEIVSNSSRNCSGFNPLTINSISSPNAENIQWQKSENCSAAIPIWTNILGETSPTYNPPALLTNTCFRRMLSDSCQTVYSNSTFFEIVPDPVISINADKTEVCFGQKLTLNKTVTGGEGICNIQWQSNKVSAAVSSSFWRNMSVSEVLEFTNSNTGNDSTFYFRAIIDCQNSSCNVSTSNAISAIFLPELAINTNFSDSTVCSGSTINLISSGCKSQILWSTGATTAQISVSPTSNSTYTVSCKNSCDEVSKNINISVVTGISAPTISVAKTKFCNAETVSISATNCSGNVIWSNGLAGANIQITATNSFSISAHCIFQNCQSPQSQTINITVYPVLTPGEIVSNSSRNCSGFNPLTINSISSPNAENIQWQKSENCSAAIPIWTNILGETSPTYNPPALLTNTCFRRMLSDSCQTVYSNSTFFEIVPDPVISINADKTEVCFGQKLTLNKTVTGGEGICNIQWQSNKVSAAVSSSFWRNLSVSEVLEFTNSNSGNDSTFYFRARIDCQNSSCNVSTSNAVSAILLPELAINTNFSDSTVCSGSTINLVSSGCKSQILWSTGATTAQISVSPTSNSTYTVSCKNSCDEVSKNINISVVPGISAPTISVAKTKFCNAETVSISATNCSGNVIWSNGLAGMNIQITATNSFSISAHCIFQNCQSPQSQTINITVYPVLTPGEIVSNSSRNCSGFNPLTINSISNPNGGTIQWQKSENCSAASPVWTDILGETALTYNPPALLTSTCFRRMASDSCQTVYSNSTFFEIVPDPVISINADKTEVCFGQKLTLNKTVTGGEGICNIQWQINKVSAAVSSSFWRNLSVSEVLEFTKSNTGNDSTFYFRAIIDCQNSSCNVSTSNAVSAIFLPELAINTNFSDSTVCSGSTINLVSSGCKSQILWSTGATTAQISVSPTSNSTYTVSCKNSCDEVSKNINISVVPGISAPTISVAKTKFCNAETVSISATNCSGNVIWSNGLAGANIQITATNSFSISAHCIFQNCQSPQSQTINITVYPVLTPGEIVSNSSRNCSGFNPLTINSISNPNGGTIQWQKSENCSAASPVWTDILGETALTYNPPALLTSTCFRRMASDSCQTVYSNSTFFEIVPDPVISITADKTEVCFGQKLTLNKTVVGGEGICGIQWQINKVSAAVSSSFWRNLSVSEVLEFTNSNTGNDSTFYFRARIDCQNSSCNVSTSNAVSAIFLPELAINTNFSDSTVCSGSIINLISSGCKSQILWSTGATTAQISVSPTSNSTYTVSCKNSCDEVSKNINISVVTGISAPTISVAKTKFCNAETVSISATNCSGNVIWSNGLAGMNIQITATNSFGISAHCIFQNCQSPQSQTINITVYPVLTPGEIVSNSSRNCSGFNPLTINSISNPNEGTIQWQKSENCSAASPVWTDILGETALTYNPPALLTSTCFRRMASDSCQTVYSNSTFFEIVPDPVISITADKTEVCFGQKLTLNKTVTGGEGICNIQWQSNKVSAAVSSSFWRNMSVSEVLEFTNSNTGNDSTFYFRARIDCQNSSCNVSTSNAISAIFLPELAINTNFSDSTVCSGSTINLISSGCKSQILWSTGATTAQISVSPTSNSTYTVSCKNSCDEVSKNINISVVTGISVPTISVAKTKFCNAETVSISATNCSGNVIWSNGLAGMNIQITATNSFSISAHCIFQNCQSPQSQTINITVYPVLTPGEIVSSSSRNCSGFNPLTINSISSPNAENIQWQKSENCSAASPIWTNILGETALTYNPPALLTSTCFRRMASDSCQTVYSNSTFFEIVPDPVISITADKTEVCFGQKLTLNKTVVGGEGICGIQWQINKISAAVSSSFWRNLSVSEVLEFTNSNTGNDSTFYFRARIDCQNSSCNVSTSNAISAIFLPELAINTNFSDSTVCSGSTINLVSSGCKSQILWSTGATTAQISVSPTSNSTYTVSCKNSCGEVSKNISISVVTGISAPTISVPKTKFCNAETVSISATNCSGNVIWSNGLAGANIQITATNSFSISAHCIFQNCQSPQSQTINITVYPVLTPGEIVSNSSRNCSGFNPLTINSISSPNAENIQWQKSENCSAASPVWTDILGETALTYNPLALLTSTCFRRMASDSCQTVYSNSTFFEIVPDPVISITADKTEVCFGEKLTLNKTVTGGEGICNIQWQINKISAAVSSSFWRNLSVSEVLEFTNSNSGNDSTFYFRARIDCQNSSCNVSTSNAVSAIFLPELAINTNFSDSTVCSGSIINLISSGCKSQILWSTGATTAQISVSPTSNSTYTVSCKNSCDEVSKNISISVVTGISAPTISVAKTKFCNAETVSISATNCSGNVIWSNGLAGANIQITATNSFSISAHCIFQNCQSPQSQTINITVYPVLTPGEIVSNSSRNCSGFNPLTINSITSPNGGTIQWQKSENCSAASPVWTDISGETALTYNPPALLTSTCFRRMASDSCQTVYSNSTFFEIVPDPVISITADKTEVCFGQKLTLNKTVVGGEGICGIQWQINKISAAVSSSFWRNLSVSEILEFTNSNLGNDSTFYFRARIDCQNSSCNVSTSNAVSAILLPELAINTNFSDSIVCSGSTINLVSSGCKSQILWSTGATTAQISVSPTSNSMYTVSCKNSCDEVSKNINISVVTGIEKPINTTPGSVLSPEILIFTASGQNIKWYSSESSTMFATNSPQVTTPGEHSFWATQTIGICESQKLKITAKLNAVLAFTSQPTNTVNCYRNTSTIGLDAEGTGTIYYKWQRKKPTENSFSDIPNGHSNLTEFNTNELKISSLGNTESPHLTKFRCIIRDNFSEIISDEVEILVNRLEGNLPNQKLCLGNNLNIDLNRTHQITGTPTLINWQYRSGTGEDWKNLNDTLNISGSKTLSLTISNLEISNQQQYRCSVLFNSTSGTCTETTDLMSLSVGSFPETPQNIGFEFCQNVSSPKLELYEPSNLDVVWYLPNSNTGLSKQPIIDTKVAGNQLYSYAFKNAAECESPKARLEINIHPEPTKPFNTTPKQVIEGQPLVFTAFGEQLKWFASRTGKTFTTTTPSHQKVGTYDYYVSQTSLKGCESERTYIEAEIIAAFGIATQPTNQANCNNNTSTFSIKTKGADKVFYRWQIKENDQFKDIPGANTSSLKIDDIGKYPNIDSTIYRCIVSNSVTEIISNEVTLRVNEIKAKLSDLAFCEGQMLNTSRFIENLKGNINQIEWQSNKNGSFNTVFTTKNINENLLLKTDNSSDYRLRVIFQNQGSSTCVRTSNNFKLTTHPKPEKIEKTDFPVCQFTNTKNFLRELPANFVLRNLDSSIVNIPSFNTLKIYDFIGNYTSEKGCSSEFQAIKINILDAPKIENLDSIYNYCQFSDSFKSLKLNNLNTFWYKNETDEESSENAFTINTAENQNISLWAAVQDTNSCLSQKHKVEFNFNPCFYVLKNDTCVTQTSKILIANDWNYFYDATGRIFGAIHPDGQNLGTARMDFRNSSSKNLKDKNLTELYPRYFNLLTSKQPNSNFKIRFYFSKDEILKLGAKTADEVSIINYNGKNLDCDPLNNDLKDNYWLETTAKWEMGNTKKIHYVEFSTTKTGEFGLWNGQTPTGTLKGEINENKIPELNISEKNNVGNYEILKSKDGKTWFSWLENITKSDFTDLQPFFSDNYYQLIYHYGNGIKSIRNTVKLTVLEEEVPCVILENPSENRELLKLYFPNIDKTSIRLNTAMGQSIDVRKITDQGDYLGIYPNTQLSAGFYTLKAQNVSGKNCSAKIWIR